MESRPNKWVQKGIKKPPVSKKPKADDKPKNPPSIVRANMSKTLRGIRK